MSPSILPFIERVIHEPVRAACAVISITFCHRACDPRASSSGLCRHFNHLLHAQALCKPRIVRLLCERLAEKIGKSGNVEAHCCFRYICPWNNSMRVVLYRRYLLPGLLVFRPPTFDDIEIIRIHEIPAQRSLTAIDLDGHIAERSCNQAARLDGSDGSSWQRRLDNY